MCSVNNNVVNGSSPWAKDLRVLYGAGTVMCSQDNLEGITVFPLFLLRCY